MTIQNGSVEAVTSIAVSNEVLVSKFSPFSLSRPS